MGSEMCIRDRFFPPYEINVSEDFEAATDKAVGRAHTAEYLEFLRQLTTQVRALHCGLFLFIT